MKNITLPTNNEWAFKYCERLIAIELNCPQVSRKLAKMLSGFALRLKKVYYPAGFGFEEILSQNNNAELIALSRIKSASKKVLKEWI